MEDYYNSIFKKEKNIEKPRLISIRTINHVLNRIFNLCLASFFIILLSPLMLLISFLILVFDRQPILYKGLRIGRGGKAFKMYKFRTLYVGTEEKVGKNLMKDDQGYITRIGHYLRCVKLDELPQLFNIIKGDMNFVGPRPVRPLMAKEYAKVVNQYHKRFAAKPGLTGLAQLRGGYYCNPSRKTRYDIFYIAKKSIALDIKLIGLTGLRLFSSPACLKQGDRPIGQTESSLETCKKSPEIKSSQAA